MLMQGTHSTYPKVAVQWLNQALCFYQSLCLVDSEVLRNRHLRVAAKRYRSVVENDETQILEICAIEKKSSFGKLEKEIGCGTE